MRIVNIVENRYEDIWIGVNHGQSVGIVGFWCDDMENVRPNGKIRQIIWNGLKELTT